MGVSAKVAQGRGQKASSDIATISILSSDNLAPYLVASSDIASDIGAQDAKKGGQKAYSFQSRLAFIGNGQIYFFAFRKRSILFLKAAALGFVSISLTR